MKRFLLLFAAAALQAKIPVIDCTDLYHPHQDPGDNIDLIAAYGLPEVDLRAVILDCTEQYRREGTTLRDAGVIPVTQLNYIFGRNVPFGISPFRKLKTPDDTLADAPRFFDAVEVFLAALRASEEPVQVVSFGSCRVVAAAYNRDPELLRRKIGCLHISAGTTSGELFDVDWRASKRIPLKPGSRGYLEWNVELDAHAFVRLPRSDLPIALYPCATENGPFAMDSHNTFYETDTLDFIRRMNPRLQAYLHYALAKSARPDFLRATEEVPSTAQLDGICARRHRVWETAVWQCATGRELVQRPGTGYRLIPKSEVRPEDGRLVSGLVPCSWTVGDDGRFIFSRTEKNTGRRIYFRGDPEENRRAMAEALAALYDGFLK